MAKDDVQTNVRLPAALKETLQKASAASGRSFTAELVYRLVKSFDSADSVMLSNRTHELGVLRAEIGQQIRHIEELEAATAPDEHALQVARNVLLRLQSQYERVLEELEGLFKLVSGKDYASSHAGRFELEDAVTDWSPADRQK